MREHGNYFSPALAASQHFSGKISLSGAVRGKPNTCKPQCTCIYIVSIYRREEGGMIVEFCRWGNSLAVRIPKALAEALKVSDGKQAEINVENGTLVLRPIVKPGRKPRYTLDELLRGMTKDNVPQELDWGPARGKEAW
jgi:antitoxin MazE